MLGTASGSRGCPFGSRLPVVPVLYGVFRFGPGLDALPAGFRGSWTDETTFEVEFDQVADQEAFVLQFRFGGDRLTLELRERTHEAGLTLEAARDRQES